MEYIKRGDALQVVISAAMERADYLTNTCIGALTKVPNADVVEVRHGEWVKHDETRDGFCHHRCSICKVDAPFHYLQTEEYDEEIGWSMGISTTGIYEHLTNYCPNCGAKMDGKDDD